MKNEPERKTDPVLIIGFIMAIFFLIMGSRNGGMVGIVMSVLAVIANSFVFIYAITRLKKKTCISCGTKAQSANDKFCRNCGTPFTR